MLGISRIHWPVTVLGPGHRVGVWFQGCSIECRGCVSRDTWPVAAEVDRIGVSEILSRIDALVGKDDRAPIDGVTLTGGEPFDQPEGLAALLEALQSWLAERGAGSSDILLYTGYEETEARSRCARAFTLADAVIVGPYRVSEPGRRWWGSANQRLIARDDDIAARFEAAQASVRPEIQVSVENGSVFIIGIPHRRTLASVERSLTKQGIELGEVSWRP